MLLYKFYSAKFGRIALEQQRLKLSELNELNDPFELNCIKDDGRLAKQIVHTLKGTMNGKGILCLSSHFRNPLMWSHYADGHRGICLELSVDQSLFSEVTYQKDRINLNFDTENLQVPSNIEKLSQLLTTKSIHWKYERELRAFFELDNANREDGLYFEPFSKQISLNRVLLGPLYQPTGQSIKIDQKISTMRLAKKTFSVVHQGLKRLQKTI